MPADVTAPSEEIGLYAAGRGGIRGSALLLSARALGLAVVAILLGEVIDRVAAGEAITLPMWWLILVLAVVSMLGGWWPRLAARTSGVVEADVRLRILETVLRNPTTPARTGEVVSRATEGAAAVGSLAGTFVPQLIGGVAIPLLICAVVAVVDVPSALVLLATVPAVPGLLRLMEKRFASVSTRYRATADRLAAGFLDGIQGMKTLRALDAADEYGNRLAEESEQLRGETMALLRVNQLVLLAVDSLFTLGTVVAAGGAAIWRLQDGAITVGQAVAITLLGVALIEPMSQIGRFFYVGAIGRAAAKDIKTFLGVLAAGDGFVPRRGCTGLVDIRDVSFSYEGGRRALDSVTLRIEPGEVVGLVGPSGAGKSTLAAIVTGLAKPSTGSVDVGGRVAMVSQRPFLFHGSVRDNLLLAAPEASESELRAALEAVELLSIVEERGEGLELELGERGLNLSGGEGQRLTIARMLLTGAPIVVLDEPTSNVDIETEATVRRAVDRLTADKTVVIITHRHSTLAGVDRIVMLDSGRIVGSGCPGTPEGQAILSRMAVTS